VTLEPNVDTAFKKQGLKKRSEVSKNIADARQLMSLMSTRVDDVERSSIALLHNMAEAAKHDAPPPPPPPPPEDEKDKKKKKKGGAAAAPAGGGAEAAPAAPKPAAPAGGAPAPKPASPDFEP
jgi:hypothetical protein